MKNLFTIIAASLLLGTASMAAEHTGIDNIRHILICVQTARRQPMHTSWFAT